LWGFAGATYITVQANGAPFTVDESILFNGTMDNNNVDVNVYVINSAGTVTDQNYLGDRNGVWSIAYSFGTAGDYNILVSDLNNGVSSSMPFSVSLINSVQINYDDTSKKPPFDSSDLPTLLPVTFTAYDAGDLNVGANQDLNVQILDSGNSVQDSNTGQTNGDGNVQFDFNLAGYSAGDYYFSINEGLAMFSFSIYSFRMYLSLTNPDTNNDQTTFKPGTNAKITVDVMNYAGTSYISGATIDGAIYNSGNVPQSALTFTSSGGSYYAVFAAPATTGEYTIDVNVNYGGSTQSQKISFKVENYAMEVVSSQFEGGGMGEKEMMPSVFPTETTATLELHFSEINASELADTNLDNICNNGSADDHNFLLYYKKMGANDWNAELSESDFNVEKESTHCSLSFMTPAAAGTYYIMVKAKDLNVLNSTLDLSDKTMVTIQNYLVFLEPVDPSTCDTTQSDVASSCGFRFSFTLGQQIGLKPKIIDLTSATSVNQIVSLSGATIFRSGSETALSSPTDVNFRADLNILEVNPSTTVNNLSGGFYVGGFTVDVNSNGTLAQSGVTAFGFFYLQVLNVTTELVDVNGNSIATHGPPTYASDQNIYIKVTVKDSDGTTAIRGAVVTPSRLINFRERETIDISSVDANATNSSGIAMLTFDYDALGIDSGEFELELDINAGTLGKSDTSMTHFERRNYYLQASPVNKSDCSSLPMVSGDMNSTFLLEGKDPWFWSVLNDLNVRDIKVFYEGSPTNVLSTPVEKAISSFETGTVTCGSDDYNYVDVNHNGIWDSGFYKFKITVESETKGTETATGYLMVQPFFIVAIPAVEGDLGEYAEPGAQWDFNIMSAVDVNIDANIISLENWTVFAYDLNMHLKSTGEWIAGTGSGNAGNDIAGQTPPTAYTTVDVNIPSNLPLAMDMEMDGYILQIGAKSATATATLELFVIPQKWQVLIAKEPQGAWTRGEPGPYFFGLTSSGSKVMLADTNVEDNCFDLQAGRGYTDENIHDGGLTYSRVVMVTAGDEDVNGTQTDWNAIILADPDSNQFYVDRDNDCNFNEVPDSTALTVGSYTGVRTNLMYEDWSQGGPDPGWQQNPFNGIAVVTGITKSKLWYTTAEFSGGDNSLLNYVSLSNLGVERDPFIGTYDTNQFFGVPIVVKTLAGVAVSHATVSIQSVMLAEMGGGMPTALTRGSDYNTASGTTDGNGLALPLLELDSDGIIMVGIRVTDGTSTQTVMPWEGAVFQTQSFSVTSSFALEDLNIQFDKNGLALGLDVNSEVIPPACFNPADTNIGVLNEKDFNLWRGGATVNVMVNFDNDTDENRVGIVDENWYFIPLTGVSCPDADFGTGVSRLLIDDDLYIDTDMGDGWREDQNGEFDHKGGAAQAGASTNQSHLDLNEITVANAAGFPVCLYGSGMCSCDGHGCNSGAIYDLNTLADNNILDGNLLVFNHFDHQDNFFDPTTYGASGAIKQYIRLSVTDLDNSYVAGEVNVSGSAMNEQTGQTVISNFSGWVPDGEGKRVELDGNFSPSSTDGSGFMISMDVNYQNSVRPTYDFMWSRWG